MLDLSELLEPKSIVSGASSIAPGVMGYATNPEARAKVQTKKRWKYGFLTFCRSLSMAKDASFT